ncbi:MAG TPA: tRNA (guanosine(46)-N7)-methyltransferase TrmB [Chthoniobacterales bacterium]|nr:tRNA (guanosine(46)-N7)-methyltransferase TrmB [Chthoniobacterales bacterium]
MIRRVYRTGFIVAGELVSSVAEARPVTELIPPSYFAPLDLGTVFSRSAPVEIDVGCGDGAFLIALAQQFPERDFLGFERMFGRVRSACRKAEQSGLTNVRIVRVEGSYAVRYLLPPSSVDVVHVLFPDPWPKKRHHRRRIITQQFVRYVQTAMQPTGLFHVATDDADYFAQITDVSRQVSGWWMVDLSPDASFPETTFEKHFTKTGAEIHRLLLRKGSPARNGSA